jgi:hypothetical protein
MIFWIIFQKNNILAAEFNLNKLRQTVPAVRISNFWQVLIYLSNLVNHFNKLKK